MLRVENYVGLHSAVYSFEIDQFETEELALEHAKKIDWQYDIFLLRLNQYHKVWVLGNIIPSNKTLCVPARQKNGRNSNAVLYFQQVPPPKNVYEGSIYDLAA